MVAHEHKGVDVAMKLNSELLVAGNKDIPEIGHREIKEIAIIRSVCNVIGEFGSSNQLSSWHRQR